MPHNAAVRLHYMNHSSTPLCRICRVLIMTDAEYRRRFAKISDWRVQAAAITVTVLTALCFPTYMQSRSTPGSDAYCIAFTPWQLWVALLALVGAPVAVLFKSLYKRDTLGMCTSSTALHCDKHHTAAMTAKSLTDIVHSMHMLSYHER
jgi:hypothetical protein